jgi:hypothetical protein
VVELRFVSPFRHPSTGNVVNNSAASSLDVLLFSAIVSILGSSLGFFSWKLVSSRLSRFSVTSGNS